MKFKAASLVAISIALRKILPIVAGLAVLILVIAYLAGVMTEKIKPGEAEVAVREFHPDRDEAEEVHQIDKPYFDEAVGTVKAANRTEISARVLAPINRIHVHVGQMVQRDDALIELDRRALQTQLSEAQASLVAAEAALKQSENDYERAAQLYRKEVISEAEMDRHTADVEVTRAKLNQAEQGVARAEVSLSYATIKAPIAALIADRWAEEGDTARPGVPLLVMYDPKSLRLEVPVREELAVNLKVGQELAVSVDALGQEVKAPIDEIVRQAEAASRSFSVKLALPHFGGLAEGMTGRAMIPAGTRYHLCLPTAAVQRIGQLQFVHVIRDDNTLERRFVKLGRFGYPGRVEVLSGLKPKERVLLRSPSGTSSENNG